MRYRIVDSHRNMSAAEKAKIADIFCEVKKSDAADAEKQVSFCDWYEKKYAVKCFEVIASDEGKIIGYMRAFRNPEDNTEWLVGDIMVREAYRKQSVASHMYEKLLEELGEYDTAERCVASVHDNNTASISLHKSLGFEDTRKKASFACFCFDENETLYRKWLYQEYLVQNEKLISDELKEIWFAYEKKQKLYKSDEDSIRKLKRVIRDSVNSGFYDFYTIWCGNRLVGFGYEDDETEVIFNTQEDK